MQQGRHALIDYAAEMVDALALDGEERVRLALATARIGIWEWDLGTDTVKWSSTTALAFGLKAENAPTSGRAFIELVHPEDRQALTEASHEAIRAGTELNTEFRTISPSGVIRWVQSHGRVVCDSDGKASRLLGVNIDITDRRLFEAQFLEARGQAERLRTLKATMRTVQDIVGNALMSLQLFRRDAEEHVSAASLELFDQIISETAGKLKLLSDLEDVVETDMSMGPGIHYQHSPPTEKP
jgi:PAS domain S-box-containing protein